MSFDIENVRSQFPQLKQTVHGKPLIYLDNAATTLKCQPVIDSLMKHYSLEVSNVHRGIHLLSQRATDNYEATRETIAQFINAKNSHEVIFTKGTTDSINMAAHTFSKVFLKKGDVILLSTMEHHSNIVPWQMVAEEVGAKIMEIPINDHGEILIEEYKKLLKNPVKMVAINHVSNTLGTINPIKELIALAHENGAYFSVDAAQSIAHMKTNVQDLNCDFLSFSGHKMYGPTGTGVLYIKDEIQKQLPPYQGGGAMIKEVTLEGTTYGEAPELFEAGTPHIAGFIALKAAVDYIQEIGMENIAKQEQLLIDKAMAEMEKIEGVRIIGTAKNKAAVLSFVLDNSHPHDLGMILDQMGVAIRTGHHCTQPLMKRFNVPATARASFSFYNSLEDVDQLVAAVKKAKEML